MPASPSPLLRTLERPFRAAIFDCDGTLADTMPIHFVAWVETLRRYGEEMTQEFFDELAGVPTADILRILNERRGLDLDVERVAHEKEARFEEMLHQATPVHHVVELAEQFYGHYRMAVASGGIRRLVEAVLATLGIRHYFSAICTAEDIQRPKPDPEVFLLAASRLGVPPEDCVVFEDADLGLEAARRAGMQYVDVRPAAFGLRTAIEAGLDDVAHGRVVSHEDLLVTMRKRRGGDQSGSLT